MLCVIKLLFVTFMVAASANFFKADHDDKIKTPKTIVLYVKTSDLEAYHINAEKVPGFPATSGAAEIGLVNAPLYDSLAHTSIVGGVSYTATCQTYNLRGTSTSETRCQLYTTFEQGDAVKSAISFVTKSNFVDPKIVPGKFLKHRSIAGEGVYFGQTWDVNAEVLPGAADVKLSFTLVK